MLMASEKKNGLYIKKNNSKTDKLNLVTTTTLTSKDTRKKTQNHQSPKLIQVSIMMLNCHAQNEVKKSSHSGDI